MVNDVFMWIILYVWHGQCSSLCRYLPHNIIVVVAVVVISIQILIFQTLHISHNGSDLTQFNVGSNIAANIQ
jgi:hypothetical protein